MNKFWTSNVQHESESISWSIMSDSFQPHGLQHTRLSSPALSEKLESEVAQSCLTLCNSMNCSLPGSSVHGIFQASVLDWVAIPFSRGSSRPRDRTRVSTQGLPHCTQMLSHLSHQGRLHYLPEFA